MLEQQRAKKASGKEKRRNAQAEKVEQKNKENANYVRNSHSQTS